MNSSFHFLDRSLPSQGRVAFARLRASGMSIGNAWAVDGGTTDGQDPGEDSA